ncbi:hypothetical protein V6N13_092837 [Hibiscus sabdariffa]|uniref:Uncharacterized protein n=1 Tax=Hibiscus sabdariffa TaxID=183260 RepID=A0ABR2P808_9ROSI
MIAHSKKGNLHVYVERQVDIPHYADEDQVNEDIDVMFESTDGGTCEDNGGGPNSCIGDTSNVVGSHQKMTKQDASFDVKVDDFSAFGDCCNEVGYYIDRDDGSGDEIDYIHSSEVMTVRKMQK